MKNEVDKVYESALLRKKAQERLAEKQSAKDALMTEGDSLRLVQELEIHQIEMEMQQEELQQAMDRAETIAEKYTDLYDYAPCGYFTLDSDARISELNLIGAKMLGKERSKLIHANFNLFIDLDVRLDFEAFFLSILANTGKKTCELQLNINEKNTIFVHIEGIVAKNERDCYLTVFDISDRRRVEQELLKIKDVLLRTNEIALTGYWELDLIQNTIFWSEITKQIHEVPTDFATDLEGCINVYKEGESRKTIRQLINTAIETGANWDTKLQIVTANGTDKWVRTIGQAEFEKGKPIKLYGTFQDISREKTDEARILASTLQLQNFFDLTIDFMSITGNDGFFTTVNNTFMRELGYSEAELLGQPYLNFIHPDDIIDTLREAAKLENGALTIDFENRYRKKNGEYIWLSWRAAPDVRTGFLFSTARDITRNKKAAEEKARLLTLIQNQNNRLQNFAYIVSHNLRSHSANISSLLSLLADEHSEITDNSTFQYLQKALDNLIDAIEHLSEVAQIRTNESKKLIPVNLHQIIEKATSNVIALAMNADVRIINNLQGSETVLGDTVYLDSIVLNFLTNAIKYQSKDRDSYVKLSCTSENDSIILQIEDNGLGIDLVRNEHKLFGMFKTFHSHPDSRGVGLFITKNQVEAIGGKIEVESEIDKGTTFKIYLQNGAS